MHRQLYLGAEFKKLIFVQNLVFMVCNYLIHIPI